jgi:hypothetical protein
MVPGPAAGLMPEKHWKSISASRFPWEQEALDFIHAGLLQG